MTFANPAFLLLLLIVPLLAAYLFFFRGGDLPALRFSSMSHLEKVPGSPRLYLGEAVVGLLRIAVLSLLIVALARPQKGLQSEEMTLKATDIIVCLDASKSMLSVDFKPDNRFQAAKNVAGEFISGRQHDRVGLVLFAEHAVTQSPLTHDKSAILNILETLEVGAIPADQTAIGVGIANSVNRLKDSQAKSKVIILVTDGSNNAGVVDPITAAKTAAAFDIRIYTIGVGSPDGGLVPIDDPLMGRRLVRTESDLDEDLLLKIAGLTDGKYFRAKSGDALKTIFAEIDQLEKTDIKVTEFVDYEDFYRGFLLAALALLFLEIVLKKTAFRTVP